jgi:hypothetical protein
MTLYLAGIPVRDDAVLGLARLVDDPDLADKLEDAYRREVKVLALTIAERETILAALDVSTRWRRHPSKVGLCKCATPPMPRIAAVTPPPE